MPHNIAYFLVYFNRKMVNGSTYVWELMLSISTIRLFSFYYFMAFQFFAYLRSLLVFLYFSSFSYFFFFFSVCFFILFFRHVFHSFCDFIVPLFQTIIQIYETLSLTLSYCLFSLFLRLQNSLSPFAY